MTDYTAKIFQTVGSEAEFAVFHDAIRGGDSAHVRKSCEKHSFLMDQSPFPENAWDCAAPVNCPAYESGELGCWLPTLLASCTGWWAWGLPEELNS
ncbi:MAG: hypothetical protein R3C53_08630 [Pirellulaceae bacterium]